MSIQEQINHNEKECIKACGGPALVIILAFAGYVFLEVQRIDEYETLMASKTMLQIPVTTLLTSQKQAHKDMSKLFMQRAYSDFAVMQHNTNFEQLVHKFLSIDNNTLIFNLHHIHVTKQVKILRDLKDHAENITFEVVQTCLKCNYVTIVSSEIFHLKYDYVFISGDIMFIQQCQAVPRVGANAPKCSIN